MELKDLVHRENFKKNWLAYIHANCDIYDDKYLSELFDKYYKDSDIKLYNSYSGIMHEMKSSQLLGEIEDKFIIVENGVLFYNHHVKLDPLVKTISQLKEGRTDNKRKRKDAINNNDTILSTFYDNAQNDDKLFMNTNYGIQLNPYSRFYNFDVASSTTIRGRSSVSLNGLAVETVFGIYRPNGIAVYLNLINNLINKDVDHLIKDLPEVSVYKVMNHLLINKPDYYAKDILYNRINKLSDNDLKKIYYSYNFKAIMNTDRAKKLLTEVYEIQNKEYYKIKDVPTKKYKSILYLDPSSPPDNIKDKMDELIQFVSKLITGFYWFEGDLNEDGKEFTSTQELFKSTVRTKVAVTDTDSLIIMIEDMVNIIRDILDVETVNEFDSLMLDYTISCFIVAVIGEVLGDTLKRYGDATLIPSEYNHIMNYKQEFLFRTLQVTEGAKNYLGIIAVQEGVYLPKEEVQIKGLSLKKSNFNETLSERASHVAVDLIAKEEIPNVKKIFDHIDKSRKEIVDMYKSKNNKDLFAISKLRGDMNCLPAGESRIKALRLYTELFGKEINVPGSFIMAKLNFKDREDELKMEDEEFYYKLEASAVNREKIAQIISVKNKIETNKDKLNEDIQSKITDYIEELTDSKSHKETREIYNKYKKELKDFVNSTFKKVEIADIDRIALPLDTEFVDPFITKYIDTNDLTIFENLASVILKGIGFEVIRNKDKRQLLTNIVSYY